MRLHPRARRSHRGGERSLEPRVHSGGDRSLSPAWTSPANTQVSRLQIAVMFLSCFCDVWPMVVGRFSMPDFRRASAGIALTLVTAFGTQSLPAQTGSPSSVSARQRPDSVIDAVFVNGPSRPKTAAGQGSNTVPVELLRHPLDQKTRRMLQKALRDINAGNFDAAIEQLQEVLTKHPDATYHAHSMLGIAYLKTGRVAEAVQSLEKSVEIVPRDAVNHFDLGLALLTAGNYERGEAEVRRAVQLDPTIEIARTVLISLEQAKVSQVKVAQTKPTRP